MRIKKLRELIKFRKQNKRSNKKKIRELSKEDMLFTQFVIWMNRNENPEKFSEKERNLKNIIEQTSLNEVREYFARVCENLNGEAKYYEAAKDIVGKPRGEFLNYRNKAYIEFLNEKNPV